MDTLVIVDMANVVGSRPDGWWRDRRGAAERLLQAIGELPGSTRTGPEGEPVRFGEVVAVLEGQARDAQAPDTLRVHRARGEGDDAVVAEAKEAGDAGRDVLVVTADRGLRSRLPDEARTAGPEWLNDLIGR